MLDVGFQELIIIFVVALLVFGPKKLPEIGRSLGRGLGELRRALEGVKETISAEEESVRRAAADNRQEKEPSPLPGTGESSAGSGTATQEQAEVAGEVREAHRPEPDETAGDSSESNREG